MVSGILHLHVLKRSSRILHYETHTQSVKVPDMIEIVKCVFDIYKSIILRALLLLKEILKNWRLIKSQNLKYLLRKAIINQLKRMSSL